MLRIALVHDVTLPVAGYGGTERVLWWLSKGLAEKGHRVLLACRRDSRCPHAEVRPVDFSRPVPQQVPDADIYHYMGTPSREPERPYVVTIHGNGKPGEIFPFNTTFLSRDHARRHGATAYVHNGIDPDDYLFGERKTDSLLFLAKASWKVKNVAGAIRIAREVGRPLHIIGGSSPWSWWWRRRRIHWLGRLGGEAKGRRISEAGALLFPVTWNEPFGLAVVEALVSGTPVLASPFGSLPELVSPDVGRLCRDEPEFVEAVKTVGDFKPGTCREWALERFHYRRMTAGYEEIYRRVLRGETLNASRPAATVSPTAACTLPRLGT